MNPKKFVEDINNHHLSIQERIFKLLTSIALTALLVIFLAGFFVGEEVTDLAALGIGFLFFFSVMVFSVKFDKIRMGANIIAFFLIFILLPFCFFTGGGINGGSPLWFVFCAVYICLVVYGWERYAFMSFAAVIFSGCYVVSYFYPETVVEHTVQEGFLDSLVSVIVVSSMLCLLLLFETKIYTSEKQLAEKQRKEIEELNRAQSSFFSSMSHEIRTPINTIIGLNEMILREHISEEVAEDARSIQSASKMLLQIINDMLDMSKIESGKMEITAVNYDVEAMLSEIVNIIWIRAKEKGLAFRVNVDPKVPAALYGDEVRLKQILINLLNNAVKYTKEGSVSFSVTCRRGESGKVILSYAVEDTGIGIKKESIPYLFTAFKRVDEERNRYIEGSGLGLAIVKQFVDLMGGEIRVDSVYTKGSNFIVEIPQKDAGMEEIGELDLESRHAMNRREHYKHRFEAPDAQIMVVDDNAENIMVVKKLLRDTKVQVTSVESGAKALKKTLEKTFDLIFMDHLMPEMDGITCFHKIREQVGGLNKETKIVALTANAGSESKALYNREGFDGFLLKPVSGEDLEMELLRLLPPDLVKLSAGEVVLLGENVSPTGEKRKKLHLLVTTESVCDLPKRDIEQRNIPVISHHVHTGKGIFLDGIETEARGLLSYMEENGGDVRSDAPEIEEYEVFFAEQLEKAQQVIHVTMDGNLGEGNKNAGIAAQSFDNVTVIDSRQFSAGIGLLVLYVSYLADSGLPVEQMIEKIEKMKTGIHSGFIVEHTDYMFREGYISSRVHALAKALMLHPVIVLKNGKMKVKKLCIGSKEHAWKQYISSSFDTLLPIDRSILFITHSGLNSEELEWIQKEIAKKVVFHKVICRQVSPALSANCGPGSFGLFFREKR